MNFFDGLTKEAQALLSIFGNAKPAQQHWSFKLEITHRTYGGTELEVVELPYQYTSRHNAQLMHEQFLTMQDEDLRLVVRDHLKYDPLGTVEKVFVRWVCGVGV